MIPGRIGEQVTGFLNNVALALLHSVITFPGVHLKWSFPVYLSLKVHGKQFTLQCHIFKIGQNVTGFMKIPLL